MPWIIALAFAALVAAALLAARRGLERLNDAHRQAWDALDLQLAKRHELVTRIIELCGRLMRYEHEALERAARSGRAVQVAAACADIPALAAAEQSHQAAVAALFALAAHYPQMAASEAFAALRERVATLDARVALCREQYNLAASVLNFRCAAFPHRVVARSIGLRPAAFLP